MYHFLPLRHVGELGEVNGLSPPYVRKSACSPLTACQPANMYTLLCYLIDLKATCLGTTTCPECALSLFSLDGCPISNPSAPHYGGDLTTHVRKISAGRATTEPQDGPDQHLYTSNQARTENRTRLSHIPANEPKRFDKFEQFDFVTQMAVPSTCICGYAFTVCCGNRNHMHLPS